MVTKNFGKTILIVEATEFVSVSIKEDNSVSGSGSIHETRFLLENFYDSGLSLEIVIADLLSIVPFTPLNKVKFTDESMID